MEIAGGGDSGGVLAGSCARPAMAAGDGGSTALSSTAGRADAAGTVATLDATTARFQLLAAGACVWQQSSEAGIAMFPQRLAMCLQQARSAGFMCALGSAHAMAGATVGSKTANIKAN